MKSFFLDSVSRLQCGWNQRPLTEEDFFRLCSRRRITVVEMPLETNGFYYCVKGRHFIAVDSRLDPYRKLLVMFHEFAHYLMHSPDRGVTASFHGIGHKTRKEKEADAFALCALLPQRWINDGTIYQAAEEEGIPPLMVADRLQIHKTMGF